MLLKDFSGQTLNLKTIYEQHSVDKPYIKKNYSDALKMLDDENKINVYSVTGKRIKGIFPNHVMIEFN